MVVFDRIRRDQRLDDLARLLTAAKGAVSAEGSWGSSAPIVAAMLAERLKRPLLLVTAHGDEADDCRDDIETVTGQPPLLLPQLEALPSDTSPDDELAAERMRLSLLVARLRDQTDASRPRIGEGKQKATPKIEAARAEDGPLMIVAPIQALMQPVPSPAAVAARSLEVTAGQRLDPEQVTAWLAAHGFSRCDQVEAPGDFARRGGIIDVFSHAHTDAVRVEFFGDEVDSIRLFDPGTQRSSHTVHSVQIPALRMEAAADAVAPNKAGRRANADDTVSFLSLLPADTIVAFIEPVEIQELGRTFWQRLGERVGMIPADAIFRRANDFTQLHVQRFASGGERAVDLKVASLPTFQPKAADALQTLCELAGDSIVVVLCDNAPEAQRLDELLNGLPQRPERVQTEIGVIHRGFCWGDTAFVPNHELFARYRQRRTLRRVAPARPIDSFFDLNPGDPVVHVLHGIGRFLGLKTLDRDGRSEEFLTIEFADKAVVHVATSQIHLVQKYIGSFRGKPTLSKLGGQSWKRTKDRVTEAVTDMAGELLTIQAARATQPGIAYPADTNWQREFEGSFLYTETPDQLRAIDEIKTDMSRPRPMDRLLCGDVGYGKTELAMRAAFKAVEYGKQAAVLVPTTVLAEQHYQTFKDRMAEYPFTIEGISRFRTKAEQTRIVERARNGQLDILIGTHRLLSADVRFADLGLVIIDEEQRFGVEAKERLKRLRATVDVLTLSATPIPRTLHMSLLGMRDISSLATPPVDRRAIVTQVRQWDDELIREALVRELSRDGQVYFVHNFVRDIHEVANRIRVLTPDARVVVGHGQMNGPELEEVMLAFLRREADVLVSTNIIESGLDIPSANTIFINRADRFGLADLHQLRGRVGRSKHRAYCYLLLSPKHPLTDVSAKRLKAIEHYSDLGAGFQIAMRDLEIRGAGNILGAEQSGHIEAVGYEMYCELLEQAVRRLKNEPAEPFRPVNLDLGVSASIPRSFIRAEKQRMEVYKRLTVCRSVEDIAALRDDLRDAYGPPPEEVHTLLALAEIRVLARGWGIRALVLTPPDVVCSVEDMSKAQALFATGPGSPRIPDASTIHWRLPRRLLETAALLDVLRAQLRGQPAPEDARQKVGV